MVPALAIIMVLIVGGVTIHSLSVGQALAPLERTVTDNTLTVSDPHSSFRVSYQLGETITVTGYAFITQTFAGTPRDYGRSLAVSYLEPRMYRVMMQQYGSIDRCPASFLNQHTRVIQMFVADSEQHRRLQALAQRRRDPAGAIPFTVTGRVMTAQRVHLPDGSLRPLDFGPDRLVLISTIE